MTEDQEKSPLIETKKTPPPLSQRLEAMKANLIREYKLNKQRNNIWEKQIENE